MKVNMIKTGMPKLSLDMSLEGLEGRNKYTLCLIFFDKLDLK